MPFLKTEAKSILHPQPKIWSHGKASSVVKWQHSNVCPAEEQEPELVSWRFDLFSNDLTEKISKRPFKVSGEL